MPAVEQTSADARRKAAREVIDILHEIATLLVSMQAHPSPLLPNLKRPPAQQLKLSALEHASRSAATIILRVID